MSRKGIILINLIVVPVVSNQSSQRVLDRLLNFTLLQQPDPDCSSHYLVALQQCVGFEYIAGLSIVEFMDEV